MPGARGGPDGPVDFPWRALPIDPGERRSGPARSTTPLEVLGLGLTERRRRRVAVQVLAGDRAPIGPGAELTEHDSDDRVHSPDQDRLGRQRELAQLVLYLGLTLLVHRRALAAARALLPREAPLTGDRIPPRRPPHQVQRQLVV